MDLLGIALVFAAVIAAAIYLGLKVARRAPPRNPVMVSSRLQRAMKQAESKNPNEDHP